MIKIRNVFSGIKKIDSVQHVEARLVLFNVDKEKDDLTDSVVLRARGEIKKPLLVAEKEEMQEGDLRCNMYVVNTMKKGNPIQDHPCPAIQKKILALPEDFTDEQKADIKHARIKDGDKIWVECEEKYIEPPEEIHSNRGGFITVVKTPLTFHTAEDNWDIVIHKFIRDDDSSAASKKLKALEGVSFSNQARVLGSLKDFLEEHYHSPTKIL